MGPLRREPAESNKRRAEGIPMMQSINWSENLLKNVCSIDDQYEKLYFGKNAVFGTLN